MTQEEAARTLRTHRRDLVLAAEGVVAGRFKRGPLSKPNKTQFSNLVGLCNEASCAEEIVNHLRYQVGRREWDRDFAESVVGGIEPTLRSLPDEDPLRVQTWKLYATYLTRAYVYHSEASRA